MTKNKISKELKASKKNTQGLIEVNPKEHFNRMSPKDLLNVLMECIDTGDYESFKEILEAYLRVHNKVGIANKMGVSRSTLYNMVSKNGNPTIENIIKLYQVVKKAAA